MAVESLAGAGYTPRMDGPILKSIQFENYRCLRDVRIEFEPLTVLVGGNATGKSSVLRGACGIQRVANADRWMQQPTATVTVRRVLVGNSQNVFVATAGLPGQTQVADRGVRTQLIELDLAQLRAANTLANSTRLASNGANFANTFVSLPRRQQIELAERFCAIVPMYRDVDMLTIGSGYHTLRFQDRWNESVWYTPDQVSDGTMLVLAYLLLMYQQPQVELVAIEEPERGLHPFLLGELVQFFRAMTRGEVGPHPVQVVLATHSAGILDHIEPREVRLLSRDRQSGEVRVETIDESTQNWRAAYAAHEHSLGGIWLSGGIGGVPSR